MAADRIVRVDVNSNLKEQTAQAKEFNKELDKAQKTATKTGSRAADAALGVSGGGRGLTRGATGAGGRGSERDFARQAQGLGGLVHVYATFAANIYAVTAAFGALQRAADTENMLRASEALSASYGISLKNISNTIKEVTDNSVSMQEALTFSNLGASAGLTSKQMTDLTKVAKGASVALGRDMTDSMQRVFRGAIKLEPELLDELGIMVKLDEATATYARELNKTANSLTSFERTQAYVNAVIEQGNRKFEEAQKLSANPYSKLLAQLQDVVNLGLRTANNVLGPIAEILSSSPTALATGLGGIVALLLRQALPAMDSLLAKTAQLSTEAATSAAELASSTEQAFDRVNAAIEPVRLSEKFSNKAQKSKALKEAIKAGAELSDALDQGFAKGTPKFDARLKALQENYLKASTAAIKDAEAKLADPKISEANKASQQAILRYYTEQSIIVQDLKKNLQDLNKQEALASKSRVDNIQAQSKARAFEAASQLGMVSGIATLISETDRLIEVEKKRGTEGLKTTDKLKVAFGSLSAGLGIVARGAAEGITKALSFLGVWGTVASLGISVLGIFTDKFKLTTDASEKASKSAEAAINTAKTLSDSVDLLAKATSLNEIFRLDTAVLSGMVELRDSMKEVADSYSKFATSDTGTLNKFFDRVQGLVGFGTTAKTTESIGSLLASVAKTDAKSNERIRKELQRIGYEGVKPGQYSTVFAGLNTTTATIEQLVEALISNEPDLKRRAELVNRLNTLGQNTTTGVDKQLLVNQSLTQTLKDLNNTTQDYVNTLVKVTPLTKTANDIVSIIGTMLGGITPGSIAQATQAATENIGIMSGVSVPESIKRARGLGLQGRELEAALSTPEVFRDIVQYGIDTSSALRNLSKQASDTAVAQAMANKALRKLSDFEKVFGVTGVTAARRVALENAGRGGELAALSSQEARLNRILSSSFESATAVAGTSITSESQLTSTIQKLAGSQVKEDRDRLSDLFKIQSNINQVLIAQYEVQAQQKVLELSMIDASERRLRISEANFANTREGIQEETRLKNEILDIDAAKLKIASRLDVEAQTATDLAVSQLARQKELNSAKAEERIKVLELNKLEQAATNLTLQDEKAAIRKLNIASQDLELAKQKVKNLEKANEIENELANRAMNRLNRERQQAFGEAVAGVAQTRLESVNVPPYQQAAARLELMAGLGTAFAAQASELQAQADQTENVLVKSTKLLEIEQLRVQYLNTINQLLGEQRNTLMMQAEQSGNIFSIEYVTMLGETLKDKFADAQANSRSVGETFADGMVSAVDRISSSITEMFVKGEFSARNLGNAVRSIFSEVIADLAAQYMKSALVNLLGSAIGSFLPTPAGFAGLSPAPSISSVPAGLGSGTFGIDYSANGNVMTEYGPLKLEKYSRGGIATKPQLSIFGEGRQNEAYVPLPDNRTIPVTLTGSTGNSVVMGDTNITVTVNSDGSSDTDVKGAGEFGKNLAVQIKGLVHKEMMDQMRPGGILAR